MSVLLVSSFCSCVVFDMMVSLMLMECGCIMFYLFWVRFCYVVVG